jgi:cysteine desulfurase
LEVRAEECLFTASGTESNNLAIAGVLQAVEQQGVPVSEMEIITTGVEHPSVGEMVAAWQRRGATVRRVSVGANGVIDVPEFATLLTEKTRLVTFAYVNSEIGTIQPVRKIVRQVAAFNKEHGTNILVHLDAAQAPLWLSCKVGQLGVDLMSLDAGKCYGPKGVGVLAYRHGVAIAPYLFGGGQEQGLRPGTENTALIVGAAKAFAVAQEQYEVRATQVAAVRDYAIEKLTAIADVELNGDHEARVANNVNVSVAGVESEFTIITLDTAGIAAATKSACGSGKGVGSAVVRTLTNSDERARTSLRFTLGEETTKKDIDRLVAVLQKHIENTRSFQGTLQLEK